MANLILNGSTSGSVTLSSPAVSGTTTLTLPATTGTVLTNASQLVGTGTTTNDSAAVGYVGEYVVSTVLSASAINLTATTTTITSISLTAGDWDVTGILSLGSSAVLTWSVVAAGFNATTANASVVNQGITILPAASVVYNYYESTQMPVVRFSLSATTIIYFAAVGVFSGGTANVFGQIRARRIR
jgi:hypothetical protein